jgi:hypothetical protein
MVACPVCNNTIEFRTATTGDFEKYDCPRCGRYQITGTALAMLPHRFETDEIKCRARLSHAIRQLAENASKGKLPEINSVNVDKLIKMPLPSIDHQLRNILKWAAKHLGDDMLGAVEVPNEDQLAGIIGTIDASRVDTLISMAKTNGLINMVPDNCISITEEGWKRLAPNEKAKDKSEPLAARKEPKIVKAHCNRCKGDRNAFVRASHQTCGDDGNEISWSDTYEVLECCGCEQMNVRHQYWCSESDEIEYDISGNIHHSSAGPRTTYWPPPIKRQKPSWSSSISDSVLRTMFDELYIALSSDLLVLSTIGARTLFDRASFLKVGDPQGGFAGKMREMQEKGYITPHEKEILEAMTDAGSASAHRGYSPTISQLNSIVDILENYIQRAFVLAEVATELKRTTPPRSQQTGKQRR